MIVPAPLQVTKPMVRYPNDVQTLYPPSFFVFPKQKLHASPPAIGWVKDAFVGEMSVRLQLCWKLVFRAVDGVSIGRKLDY
jgi:hypothetical protein